MNEAFEAAGTGVTAALAAHAIDPPGAQRGAAEAAACRNCGAQAPGNFCPNCGQATHLHRSFTHAVEEFLHGVWHFDGKAWRTLPKLALDPGRLTRDYIHGHRARYIAPLALFLLSMFLMFFVFGLAGAPITDISAQVSTVAEADRGIVSVDADIAAAERDPARREELAGLRAVRELLVARRARLASGKPISDGENFEDAVAVAERAGLARPHVGDSPLETAARRAVANPELFLTRIQNKGYKLSFLLVPLSLPWLWLAFVRRRDVRLYDHVVFLLYGLSFMALLLVVSRLLAMANAGGFALVALMLIFPLHLARQLRGAYGLSIAGTAWRTVYLVGAAAITLMLYMALIVALGLLD